MRERACVTFLTCLRSHDKLSNFEFRCTKVNRVNGLNVFKPRHVGVFSKSRLRCIKIEI